MSMLSISSKYNNNIKNMYKIIKLTRGSDYQVLYENISLFKNVTKLTEICAGVSFFIKKETEKVFSFKFWEFYLHSF